MSAIPKRKQQKTIKAFASDIALINERARGTGHSAAEIIHSMCEDLRKEAYLQELGESFELTAEQRMQFEAEHKLWDSTLFDGLDNAT